MGRENIKAEGLGESQRCCIGGILLESVRKGLFGSGGGGLPLRVG